MAELNGILKGMQLWVIPKLHTLYSYAETDFELSSL